MTMMGHIAKLAPLPIVVPMVGAAVLAGARRWLSRAAADSIGITFGAATLVISSLLLAHATHGTEIYWFGNWFPRGSMVLGITFVIEPVSAGLATLAALLTLLALIFSWRFVDSGGNHLQPLMLVFLAAMSGFVLTGDLFNLFVFFELMSTAAFALCGLKTAEPAPLQGALNFAITNSVGAFMILSGIGLLYAVTGALNMAQIGLALGARHDPLVLFAFTLLTCGFFIKAAIVPFHFWLPDAHAVAPTPVCVLFSGLMVELGLYAVVRLHSVIFAQTFLAHKGAFQGILLVTGGLTVVVGGVMCYAEHHLKRMLAFSTICHAGLMLLAFAIQGPVAVAAMLTYLLAHAFVKSGLFFTAGVILHRLRSISEKALYGAGKRLWVVAALWFLGGAGLAGAPPFATMLAEAGVSPAEKDAGLHGVALLFIFGGLMTGGAVFRIGMHTFFGWGAEPKTDPAAEMGELPETAAGDRDIFWYHYLPPVLCMTAALALPFLAGWMAVLRNAAAEMVNQQAYLHTVYTGQTVTLVLLSWESAIPEAGLHGAIAIVLAAGLACSSVFRRKLRKPLRVGDVLEGPMRPWRDAQSGHPGDYVMWVTVGVAAFGTATMFLLR
jgi:multicomponent Na+:H+ antiporter subunit D